MTRLLTYLASLPRPMHYVKQSKVFMAQPRKAALSTAASVVWLYIAMLTEQRFDWSAFLCGTTVPFS